MIEKLKEMFDISQGNRTKAAKFVAQHGLIPINEITEENWVELYDYYVQRHEENGKSFTDFDSFKNILLQSFPYVNNLSRNYSDDKEQIIDKP